VVRSLGAVAATVAVFTRNFMSNSPMLRSTPTTTSQVASSNSSSGEMVANNSNNSSVVPARNRRRRRREIIRMDESEYEGYAVLEPKPPLLDRRGESQSHYFKAFAPEKRNSADMFSFLHGDWDLKPSGIKRWWASVETEGEIQTQA
jgi:hypothetical protein